jgi:crotonobetainyl-CoA:carnitine CoA-transferase CaiB-like acyl-CoA transferase
MLALAVPHAAMMLGDLGAKVIKVECPGSGDDTRGWGRLSSDRRTSDLDMLPPL